MGNTDQKSEGEYFVSLHYDILNNFDEGDDYFT